MSTKPSEQALIPQAFIWRRLHSLAGVWLVIFVIGHLFTNSQAALFIGDDGIGFIRSVNSIHDLPYLPVIEIVVLALPILLHLIWGIKYLLTAKYNSFGDGGTTPYLPEYPRNKAYTWQRITSWLLIVGIIAHVVHMRFVEYPMAGKGHTYMVKVSDDTGLHSLASRLGVTLYQEDQVPQGTLAKPLGKNEVIAVADNFGTAELLMVRDTFKMPSMIVLYTLLVLATCYHAFNGLWTAMITWGVTLSARSQNMMRVITVFIGVVVTLLGLAAVWLTK